MSTARFLPLIGPPEAHRMADGERSSLLLAGGQAALSHRLPSSASRGSGPNFVPVGM